MSITLSVVDSKNKDLHELVAKLDKELRERYPQQGIFGVDFSNPKVQEMTFVVAYDEDQPVGCGAVRPLDDESVELKRFYVDKAVRNQGIASRILSFLEEQSKARGFRKMKLETGREQPEAVKLYKKCGYYEIDLFGEYLACNSEYSLCFEKLIG